MKRLTERINDHVYYTKGAKYELTIPAECEPHEVRDILKRLAAYEDACYAPAGTELITSADLRELVQARQEGRCVVLPKPEDSAYDGLKVKYRVYKAKDNTPVENCFVLRPDKDAAAIQALISYAIFTSNRQLAKDILDWIRPYAEAELEAQKGGESHE